MRQLLNTLFVTSEDIYLSLDGENVVANRGGEAVARYPMHTLQSIVSFSYAGASPALMGACAQREIGLAFCSPRGKFLARVAGQAQGNVLLRRMQYRMADDPSQSCRVAGMMIFGKVYNAKWSVERTRRDHVQRIDDVRFSAVSDQLQGLLPQIAAETSLDSLRGLEGIGAAAYFSVLDDMILQGKETFFFRERSRRPPLDAFNALLSFAYSLLAHDCASALESVGLDAYVGYLHRDRPGRESLALDLMEELRPCFADRFVLTLINNRVLKAIDFDFRESGAVLLTDTGRRTFLQKWQERKRRPSRIRFSRKRYRGVWYRMYKACCSRGTCAATWTTIRRFYGSEAPMLVLITYDVNTRDAAGRGRLRRIAKECVNYGQRVQNSVFECLLDTAQCRKLQNELCKIIDPEKDSLRFYYLGKKYENKIEHFGCKQTYLPEEPMIL